MLAQSVVGESGSGRVARHSRGRCFRHRATEAPDSFNRFVGGFRSFQRPHRAAKCCTQAQPIRAGVSLARAATAPACAAFDWCCSPTRSPSDANSGEPPLTVQSIRGPVGTRGSTQAVSRSPHPTRLRSLIRSRPLAEHDDPGAHPELFERVLSLQLGEVGIEAVAVHGAGFEHPPTRGVKLLDDQRPLSVAGVDRPVLGLARGIRRFARAVMRVRPTCACFNPRGY